MVAAGGGVKMTENKIHCMASLFYPNQLFSVFLLCQTENRIRDLPCARQAP
jgi:hypothetical protein